MDMGDFVIIVNASKVSLSGSKKTTKMAYRHSGFPGGLSATPFGELLEKDARKAIENAVWGMLPKNKLGRQILKKLKVYAGAELIGLELDEHIANVVAALQPISKELGLRTAATFFDQALAIDPGFSRAHASRARTYLSMAEYYVMDGAEALRIAREAADRVVFMDAGVVVEEGAPDDVLLNPQNERTRNFLRRVKDEHQAEIAYEEETAKALEELGG